MGSKEVFEGIKISFSSTIVFSSIALGLAALAVVSDRHRENSGSVPPDLNKNASCHTIIQGDKILSVPVDNVVLSPSVAGNTPCQRLR